LVSLVLLTPVAASAADKDAALVIDAQTGKVLYARNADAPRIPASLTKMMTLYLLFEQVDKGKMKLNDYMRVSAFAASQEPSRLGLRKGETIKVKDAIYALVIRSANDVAVVVAEAIGGTEAKFARMMTQKARSLRMANTTFYNASGLPHPYQRTTARDLAQLGQALMKNYPHYYDYFKARAFTYDGHTYTTHNELLRDFNGANGIKTGYTRASGFNLTTAAERDGKRIIGVVLGGRTKLERDAEMRVLLESTFQKVTREPTYVASYVAPSISAPVQVATAEITAPITRSDGVRMQAPPPPDEEDLGLDEPVIAEDVVEENVETAALPEPEAAPGTERAEVVLASTVPSPVAKPEALRGKPQMRTAIDRGAKPAFVTAAATKAREPQPKPAALIQTASIAAVPASIVEQGDTDDPRATAANDNPPDRSWGIQVGAFRQRDAAVNHVTTIANTAGELLGEAEAVVSPYETEDGVYYRVRFGPYDAKAARAACAKLYERNLNCLAVADTDWSVDQAAVQN
jgi:D-alanyl-D-alanine carboxypeptidase